MTMKPIVHVVDDDESLLTSLLRLLRGFGFDAAGYTSAGEFLLRRPTDRHGCVLLDVRMPGPSGLELQAVLGEQGVHLPVVIMTGHADVSTSVAALKGGAIDYLEKPIEPELLRAVIKHALSRDEATRSIRRERLELETLFKSLSPRERQVFDRIVSGKLNKQIALELDLAERTVKAQRASLMMKLGANSPAELGRLAERRRTAIGDDAE
jgi:FixJ family two-component response regulator